MKNAFLALLVLGGVCAAEAPEAESFQAYPLGFSDPVATEDIARNIAGPDGTVTVDVKNNRLLVVTTASRHARLAEMMKELNAPPKNVQIEVRFIGRGAGRASGVSVGAQGKVTRSEGITHTTFKVTPRVENQSFTASSGVSQMLMVASGREAFLQIGESVPYLEWIADYGLRCGALQQKVQWQNVGSYLAVQPTVIGEGPMMRITLTPELRGLVDGQPLQTRFAQVATEIVASDGQTVSLGGLQQANEFYSMFLVGLDVAGREESLQITLTPRIVR